MKLSDAIEQGSQMGIPQVYYRYLDWDNDESDDMENCQINGCCALGAAFLALYPDPCQLKEAWYTTSCSLNCDQFLFHQLGFEDYEVKVEHPVVGGTFLLTDAITSLNDGLKWPIPKIIEWLRSIGL